MANQAWRRALQKTGLPLPQAAEASSTAPPDLLDQQLWVWGKDIHAAGGNALVRFGFQRCACPEDQSGGTQYRLTTQDVDTWMWGFAVCWTPMRSPVSVLLRRYAPEPIVLKACQIPDHVWKPAQLPADLGACPAALVADLCDWIAAYERWAWPTLGAAHRRTAIAAWHKLRVIPAGRMAGAWARLARLLRQ